jgi:Protein of unknown function (DUF2752)
LAWLTGFAAVGVGLSALYAGTGRGLGCPFRTVTGWDCPFCGGTRLGGALLHGDLVSAFWFNPVVFVGLGVLSVLGLLWAVEVLGGPRVRLPDQVAGRLRGVRPNTWLLIAGVIAVGYTLLRNLL